MLTCIFKNKIKLFAKAVLLFESTRLPHEGNQVVLAQREHLDVLDDHHLVVVLVEHGALHGLLSGLLVALGEKETTRVFAEKKRLEFCLFTFVKNIMALAALIGVSLSP